jgi:hypothetical protein
MIDPVDLMFIHFAGQKPGVFSVWFSLAANYVREYEYNADGTERA